jgi:hypothetical protein
MLIPQISGSEFLISFPSQTGQVSKVRFARAVGKRFLIALTDELELAGLQPVKIAIRADLLREKYHRRTNATLIQLDVVAAIPNATYGQFIDAVLAAKAKCLLDFRGRSEISINARLEGGVRLE